MKKSVHIFNCSNNKSLFGLTYETMGTNLPKEPCKEQWQKFLVIQIAKTDPVLFFGLHPKDILEKLDKNGFAIYQIKSISNLSEIEG